MTDTAAQRRLDEPPLREMWTGWARRLWIAYAAFGLALALWAVALADAAPQWINVAQGLWMMCIVLLSPLNVWHAIRVIGTVLAAVGTGIVVFLVPNNGGSMPEVSRWIYAVSLLGFTLMGAVSLWRPRWVLGDPTRPRKRLPPASTRRIVRVLAIVAVTLVWSWPHFWHGSSWRADCRAPRASPLRSAWWTQ